MCSHRLSLDEAYRRLSLEPGAGLAAAKSAFRRQVKSLHPDTAPATPETLTALASAVAAIRRIEAQGETQLSIEIRARDAARGVTRSLRANGRPAIVRIPAGAVDGEIFPAVGDPSIRVAVRVTDQEVYEETAVRPIDFDALDDFISEFSRPSAASRFARWIREAGDDEADGRSAA